MLKEHAIQIRVRYCETDAMGFLHHSQFFNFFEQGRTELLRAQGGCYRDMEESGLFLVVVRLQCSYHSPARYDDVLTLTTKVENVSAVKIEHSYRLHCGDRLLASASSTLACVDGSGKIQRLPDSIAED
ncbi:MULTISPECIES: acyl-CoA thioesterase [unclassified Schlesneria]|uniref:acyl-CoA thioesterase n=1 Tax=unclassified Schlesneria TaxID=2762017 RepID=UPI002EE34D40